MAMEHDWARRRGDRLDRLDEARPAMLQEPQVDELGRRCVGGCGFRAEPGSPPTSLRRGGRGPARVRPRRPRRAADPRRSRPGRGGRRCGDTGFEQRLPAVGGEQADTVGTDDASRTACSRRPRSAGRPGRGRSDSRPRRGRASPLCGRGHGRGALQRRRARPVIATSDELPGGRAAREVDGGIATRAPAAAGPDRCGSAPRRAPLRPRRCAPRCARGNTLDDVDESLDPVALRRRPAPGRASPPPPSRCAARRRT